MASSWTVYLYRSGRVFILEGVHSALTNDKEQPLLTEIVVTESTSPTAILGKVLLAYVDKANQPYQHICMPCDGKCRICKCGLDYDEHYVDSVNETGHSFIHVDVCDKQHAE